MIYDVYLQNDRVCSSLDYYSQNTRDFCTPNLKLQLHDAIYRLRFYSSSLSHILSLSNSHNDVASIQKNRGDKSHHVIVALTEHAL